MTEHKDWVIKQIDDYQEDVKVYQAAVAIMWRDFLLEYRVQCLNIKQNVIGGQLIGKTP